MKPFMIGDKRFAFDVTNADDLRRLERADAVLEKHSAAADAQDTPPSASEQMQALYDVYYDFFEAVFPGRAAEIVGVEPSVGRARRAFDRFAAYLRGCVEEEERNERMMRMVYLGTPSADASVPDAAGKP